MRYRHFVFCSALAALAMALPASTPLADEATPYTDPRPCQIMRNQIESFVKTDPLKGASDSHFTDWALPPETEQEKERHLFQRVFAPGIGKAFLYQPRVAGNGEEANEFDIYLKEQGFVFS